MKKQWNIRAGEMEAFHLQLQERAERIQKLKAVVSPLLLNQTHWFGMMIKSYLNGVYVMAPNSGDRWNHLKRITVGMPGSLVPPTPNLPVSKSHSLICV